jgi:multicomponent K+:H+ antiporter subunit E
MKNVMKSIFPAPLLSVALLVLWLLLNRSVSAGQILLGLILGLLIPVLLRGLRPLPVRVSHPLSILKLAFRVVCDTSVSNFNVVRFCCCRACASTRRPLSIFRSSCAIPTGWRCWP